jgi:hypothetical protein
LKNIFIEEGKIQVKNLNKKILIFILSLFFNISLFAGDIYKFYENKDFQEVNNLIEKVNLQLKISKFDYQNFQYVIGLLSEIFKKYPKEKYEILEKNVSKFTKGLFLVSLYRAGLEKDADDFNKKELLNEISIYKKEIILIEEVIPKYNPSENDLLLGAFSATGNNLYIKNILNNFLNSEMERQRDVVRVALVKKKFGNKLSQKSSNKNMINAILKKYKEKDFFEFMTSSSGLWALMSLSSKDNNLSEKLENILNEDKKLSLIIKDEINNFQNYLIFIILSDSIKNNNKITNKDLELKVEKFIYEYENLKKVEIFEIDK